MSSVTACKLTTAYIQVEFAEIMLPLLIKKDRLPSYAGCKKKSYYHPYFSHSAHCSYLNIYISQKIRLCVVDLEDQFQITLQAKPINLFI